MASHIGRRKFLATLGGAAAAWPLAARAQQAKLPRIGVFVPANPEPFLSAFRASLREHGYIQGQNIELEFRSAEGKPERLRGLADEFVRLKVDVIVAHQTPAVTAARQATTEIPIVMAPAGDPVGTGLISSLVRPGGNITGLSSASAETGAKTLELIREVLPSARRVAVLADAPNPFSMDLVEQIENGGRMLGVAIQPIRVRRVDEFNGAFATMVNEGADAVIVQGSLPRKPAIDLALKHRLPLIGVNPFAREGGLMSYSAHTSGLFGRAAYYVDRILKGAKPADLPVEQPTKYVLVINLKTAKALGLEVPTTLLARADEVIE
jgi:putative tryptophan/tyrosine transport system substrate-binding protein